MHTLILLFLFCFLAQPARVQALALTHTPRDGQSVQTARPPVTVYLPLAASAARNEAKLWMDGREVSRDLRRTAAFVSYEPKQDLSPGNHTVRFSMGDYDLSWTFAIALTVRIQEIRWTGPPRLQDLDEVEVQLEGQAGYTARFQVEGVTDKVVMKEIRPGVYSGKLTVPANLAKISARLIGELSGPGFTESKLAAKQLRFSTSGFRLILTDPPSEDEPLLGNLTLKGRTRPGVSIRVKTHFYFPDGIEVVSAKTGPLPPESVSRIVSDPAGQFEINVTRPPHHEKLLLNVSLEAEDEAGDGSQKIRLHYRSWEKPRALPYPKF